MELVKDVVVDFCLFSLIEGFIFCLFFEKIGRCKKFKWYEIFVLSLGNCIISQIFPPVLYQIIILFYMSFIIKLFDNKYKIYFYIKITFISIIFMLIFEVGIFILYDIFFNLIFTENTLKTFLGTIPIRILQIYIIFYLFKRRIKLWKFGLEKYVDNYVQKKIEDLK